MVMLVSTTIPTPSEQAQSLRGTESPFEFDDIGVELDSLRFKVCKYTMEHCAVQIRKDRACKVPGECNDAYIKILMPITHSFCKFASEKCDVSDVDETLNKLYSAGALSDDPAKVKEIDHQIDELKELRHKMKLVSTASAVQKVKEANAHYNEEYKLSHSTKEDKIKEKPAENSTEKYEAQTATV